MLSSSSTPDLPHGPIAANLERFVGLSPARAIPYTPDVESSRSATAYTTNDGVCW